MAVRRRPRVVRGRAEVWTNTNRRRAPYQHVRIVCDEPRANIELLLGEGAPTLQAEGGWETTARPQQVGMTTFAGMEPYSLSLPVMLDGYSRPGRGSVERARRVLYRLMRGDEDSPPGIVTVRGIPLPATDWVITGIEEDDSAILRADDGHRLRQAMTLSLVEYVEPTYLQLAKRALAGAKNKTKVVKAKKGDTVGKLLRRHHVKYADVRDLNPWVKKVGQKLKTGKPVRIPVKRTARRRGRRRRR